MNSRNLKMTFFEWHFWISPVLFIKFELVTYFFISGIITNLWNYVASKLMHLIGAWNIDVSSCMSCCQSFSFVRAFSSALIDICIWKRVLKKALNQVVGFVCEVTVPKLGFNSFCKLKKKLMVAFDKEFRHIDIWLILFKTVMKKTFFALGFMKLPKFYIAYFAHIESWNISFKLRSS